MTKALSYTYEQNLIIFIIEFFLSYLSNKKGFLLLKNLRNNQNLFQKIK